MKPTNQFAQQILTFTKLLIKLKRQLVDLNKWKCYNSYSILGYINMINLHLYVHKHKTTLKA